MSQEQAAPQEQQAEKPSQPKHLADYKNLVTDNHGSHESVKEAYERNASLEKELHAAKEALRAAESRIDPATLRESLKKSPTETLDQIGVDFTSLLDVYLQGQVQNAQPEEPEPQDPVDTLAAQVSEIKQQLQQRHYEEVKARELSAIQKDLESVSAPALQALANQGQPVSQWVLDAALRATQQGERNVDYRSIIEGLEKHHRAYFEQLAQVYGAPSASGANQQRSAATLTNRLAADPPNERRETANLDDRRNRAREILQKGWGGSQ